MAVSQGSLEQTPPSVLAALAHGFEQRNVECSKPTHKIRVDFKVGPIEVYFQYHAAHQKVQYLVPVLFILIIHNKAFF